MYSILRSVPDIGSYFIQRAEQSKGRKSLTVLVAHALGPIISRCTESNTSVPTDPLWHTDKPTLLHSSLHPQTPDFFCLSPDLQPPMLVHVVSTRIRILITLSLPHGVKF